MIKEKLKEAMEFAKENGLSSIEVDGVKFNIPQAIEAQPENDIAQPATPWDNLSEDEILFWATGYYDELQENKKLKDQYKKESEDLNG